MANTKTKKPAPRKRPTAPKKLTADDLRKKHEAVLRKYFGNVEDVDSIELDRYCRLIIKIEALRDEVEGEETVYQGNGYKPNPLLPVIKEYEYQAAMIAQRLGLHLATRQAALGKMKRNAKVDPPKPKDEDEDLEAELASGGRIPEPV